LLIASTFFVNALAENGYLFLHHNPQDEVVKIVATSSAGNADPIVFLDTRVVGAFGVASYGEKRGNKGLLHVGEAKIIGDISNGFAQGVRKFDVLVVSQFLLPEVAVVDALLEIWVGKKVFSVETRWSFLSQS
jgi:hypothetical protein